MIRLGIANLARPKATLWAWIVATVLLAAGAVGLQKALAEPTFIVKGTPSEHAFSVRRAHFGAGLPFAILVEGPRGELRRQGVALAHALDRKPHYFVLSPWESPEARDLRPGRDAAVLAVTVNAPAQSADDVKALAVAAEVRNVVDRRTGGRVRAAITGPGTIGLGLQEAALSATEKAELIAAPLLLIVLLFVFRSLAAAAVPLVFGGASVAAGFGALHLATAFVSLDAMATTFASLLGLALGVDYSLLMVSRFREELKLGATPRDAAAESLRTAGKTVSAAALLLIVGMIVSLLVLPGGTLFSAAFGALTVTAISVVSATLVLPSVLALLGPNINRWRVGRQRRDGQGRFARAISRRPAPIAAIVPVVMLLALLALPTTSLKAETPSPELLPPSNRARIDYDRFRHKLGPGWVAPFDLTAIADHGSVAKPKLLRRLHAAQERIAMDPDVALVVGAGSLAKPLAELGALPRGLASLDGSLAKGKRQLGKLDGGLGRASAGADRLQAGLRQLDAAGRALRDGNVSAADGARRLRDGLDAAAQGADELSAGLKTADEGATKLESGAGEAARGADRLTRALGTIRTGVSSGLEEARAFPAGLRKGSSDLGRLREPAQIAEAQLGTAMQKLRAMTVGKADSQYQDLYKAVGTASGAVSGRNPEDGSQVAPGYRGLDTELAGAQSSLTFAAGQADRIVAGLEELKSALARVAAGSATLGAGIDRLRKGAASLKSGLGRLGSGSGELSHGVQALADGAGKLAPGVARLAAGTVLLARGLDQGLAGSGRLSGGVRTMHKGTERYGASLPTTTGLNKLQAQSPGLFKSGYFALAALDGAPHGARNSAAYTVDLEHGGGAAQMVVLPKSTLTDPATTRLRDRLTGVARDLERQPGVKVAVGGVAAETIDYRDKTMSRLGLLVVLLSVLSYLLLVVVLRSLVLPLVAVVLNLMTIGAMLGALVLLFRGDSPILGGPGYIDTLALIGTFAVTFALSIDYEVFLLTRMREGYALTGTTEGAIAHGLGHTARIITGAAAIMIAVFIAFAVTDFQTIRVLGVGLAVGIAIDATVVRLFLLPAIMRACGRLNWWFPAWLDRRLPALAPETPTAPTAPMAPTLAPLPSLNGDYINGPAPALVQDRSGS